MSTVVETINLFKTYKLGDNSIEVLKNISLKIEKEEFVSIMGPSGSGKSTLLYILGGLEKPTNGNIKINGVDFYNMKDKDASVVRRQNIGFVFQFYNLVPDLTVEENILLPILFDGKKIKEYRKKLLDLLEVVELTNRREHTPLELSGGQQQRAAIARALINDPDIILADEPIGNLDSKSGTNIMKLLEMINKERGKTIIQVTHSKEAAEYGKRIIKINDGEIE